MKLKIIGGVGASVDAVVSFQDFLGYPISEAVKNFVKIFDGGEPEPNVFLIENKKTYLSSSIKRFFC